MKMIKMSSRIATTNNTMPRVEAETTHVYVCKKCVKTYKKFPTRPHSYNNKRTLDRFLWMCLIRPPPPTSASSSSSSLFPFQLERMAAAPKCNTPAEQFPCRSTPMLASTSDNNLFGFAAEYIESIVVVNKQK